MFQVMKGFFEGQKYLDGPYLTLDFCSWLFPYRPTGDITIVGFNFFVQFSTYYKD